MNEYAKKYVCIKKDKEFRFLFKKGDIIVMEPMEATDFECLEDGTQNVVVKYPGVNNDKYI